MTDTLRLAEPRPPPERADDCGASSVTLRAASDAPEACFFVLDMHSLDQNIIYIECSHATVQRNRGPGEMQEHMELARRLLLEPVNSVSEVALRCGYVDVNYYSRVFRKLAGCFPREFCNHPGHVLRQGAPASPVAGGAYSGLPAPHAAQRPAKFDFCRGQETVIEADGCRQFGPL